MYWEYIRLSTGWTMFICRYLLAGTRLDEITVSLLLFGMV